MTLLSESRETARVLKKLRQWLPSAVIWKHSDHYTAGIPDFSVTLRGVTTWFEAKIAEDPNAIDLDEVPALQWENLRRLERGWLVFYTPAGYALYHVPAQRRELRGALHLYPIIGLDMLIKNILVITSG